ncbi:MAG: HD domain-containing protein [Gemmatimonadaceae bacterium]
MPKVLAPRRKHTGSASRQTARQRSVRRLARACQFEEVHSLHVQRLALQLFDSIGRRIGCLPADRITLSDAAVLHDVGRYVRNEDHNKHSYDLIMRAESLAVSAAERAVIANIARYHRGPAPRKKHRCYGDLEDGLRRRVVRLAALLRVADGFDRGHVSAVQRLETRWTATTIRITPVPRSPRHEMGIELWGATRKARLLARIAARPLEILYTDGEIAAHIQGADD